MAYRDLAALHEFAEVVALERAIWGPGYDDVVPVPILAVTVKRGGILIGAFSGERMVGFVYSLAALKRGRATQWSHMLGLLPDYRRAGIGRQLKRLQRERALALGVDLIEWTFDPLLAVNAHLNFAGLGIIVDEYEVNVYGTSGSPLHGAVPTDRFVAEWWITDPKVERRIAADDPLARPTREAADGPRVNTVRRDGEWSAVVDVDLSIDAPRLTVEIPPRFGDMLIGEPALAMQWRLAVREIFTKYLPRGYRVVDFMLDRETRGGAYVLAKTQP